MSSHFDIFPYVWLGGVALLAVTFLVWSIYELRRGEARWGWVGTKVSREEEPFYFWMLVLGRFAGFVMGCFMFWLGLDMLRW
jgi:hypothetical protein